MAKRVVYLFGAGASQACIDSVEGEQRILMKDLNDPLGAAVKGRFDPDAAAYRPIANLIADVINSNTQYEHVITFLRQSPSEAHRRFAHELSDLFAMVLRDLLKEVEDDLGEDRFLLYAALLDMHTIDGFAEQLRGVLTLNYDTFFEAAAQAVYGGCVDYGVPASDMRPESESLRILKLHGSFGWQDEWPIQQEPLTMTDKALWIPPGIDKGKAQYPFNVLWGLARELLDCDVLRVVGCGLHPTDWDLIALLFTTRYGNATAAGAGRNGVPYTIEVIDAPHRAWELRRNYPYLDVQSMLEIEAMGVGKQLVGEFLCTAPQSFTSLDKDEAQALKDAVKGEHNWFELWLQQMGEGLVRDPNVGSIATEMGILSRLVEG